MQDCKHKVIHTEKLDGSPGTRTYLHFSNEPIITPPRNSYIIQWCADCGEKLKVLEIKDFVK